MIIHSLLCCLAVIMPACGDKNEPVVQENPVVTVDGDVKVLTTTATKSYDLTPSTLSFSTKDNMSPLTVKINQSVTFQPIDGFGAAITGSTAVNLLKMSADDRTSFLKRPSPRLKVMASAISASASAVPTFLLVNIPAAIRKALRISD